MMFRKKAALELGKEYPTPGEPAAIERINALIREFLQKEYGKSGKRPALRTVHAKALACLKAQFIVESNLPTEARVGLFSQARSYPCWLRFSNGSHFVQQDAKDDVRGLAIKVMGVAGEKILEDEKEAPTQDFILLSSKNFPVSSVEDFARFTKWFLIRNNPYGYFISLVPRRWRQAYLLSKNIRIKILNPLAADWYSTTPSKWGEGAVKYRVHPAQKIPTEHIDRRTPDFMRQAMADYLKTHEAVLDFSIQFQVDPYKMPVEDASRVWSEKLSPFIKVATIKIPPQEFTSDVHNAYCEHLAFSTWHALPAHRPLGGLNRSHRSSYILSAKLRHDMNKVKVKEPSGFEDYEDFMHEKTSQ